MSKRYGKFGWTAKRAEKAQRFFAGLSKKHQRTVQRMAATNGCEGWEVIADFDRRNNEKPRLDYHKYFGTKRNAQEPERITRWANLIDKHLAEYGANDPEKLDLIRAAAAVAGMPPTAFIIEMIKRDRGFTAKPTVEAKYTRRTDESYEDAPTRVRNRHDREIVDQYVSVYSTFGSAYSYFVLDGLTHAEQVEAVRRYFKFGDRSYTDTVARAIHHALQTPCNAAA